ncbi:MAG: hypothetical protein WEE89_03300 [Gemmatimonadota bacterium]
MKNARWVLGWIVAVAVAIPDVAPGQGRGRGGGADKKQDQPKAQAQAVKGGQGSQQKEKKAKPNQAGGNKKVGQPDRKATPAFERAADDRGNKALKNGGKYKHNIVDADIRPSLRRFITSTRAPELVLAGAVARAHVRGVEDADIVIVQVGDRTHLRNRSGISLLELDNSRARNLGHWSIDALNEDVRSGAPSFCRSGAGHPVFGRQWCVDKGFGLGGYRDLRWGSTNTPDVIFSRQVDNDRLSRSVLIDVLGDIVFNRLALHAVTLGFSDPLTGVWLGEPTGPRILRLDSGDYPIAEIVDNNRDNRADVMVVALRPW